MGERAPRLIDSVSPNAILRAINRTLRPFSAEGLAIDVQNGLTGAFLDEDFFDYYEPGDLFPEDPWKLSLSIQEAYGFFLVIVPFLGEGEFGMFFDDSPPILLPDGSYLANAFDYGFFDGSPVTAEALYAAIYNSVNVIRAGGVGFDLIRSEIANALASC